MEGDANRPRGILPRDSNVPDVEVCREKLAWYISASLVAGLRLRHAASKPIL
jgi:hypothetical protein